MAVRIIPSWRMGARCFFTHCLWLALCFATTAQSRTLYEAAYAYDARGMVTNVVEAYDGVSAHERVLEYDSLGRLCYERILTHEVRFEYDRLGNRILEDHPSDPEQQRVYRYNNRNELVGQTLPDQVGDLFYDLNGSLTQKVFGTVSTCYEWDSRGRLKRVTTNGVEGFRADYAGALNRIRKTEGSASKVYRHDGATAIQEVDAFGAMKEWVRGDRGASTVGGVLYSADEEGTNTYTYNGVGSTVALSGDDGSVRIVQYGAFGDVLEGRAAAEGERLANTREFDESLGLYFHGARYYDATTGRYISLDPARDGANFYVYAQNAAELCGSDGAGGRGHPQL